VGRTRPEDLLFYGEKECLGPTVVVWESLSEQDKASWLEEAITTHDLFVLCKSKKWAEEIRSVELSVVYGFINHMGLDPTSDVEVSTPLNPHEVYSKADPPPEIDVKLRDKVCQAHSKLIHLAIWARPNLVQSVLVLRWYVQNPSEELWSAYSRIAKYLVRLETPSSFSVPQTSNLWISSPIAILSPTGVDLLTIENLQASIYSLCSAQRSAGK